MSDPTTSAAACLQVREEPHRLQVFRSAQDAACLTQNAVPGRRPFIHPLISPDGQGCLTEDAPSHHPWQHGLYTGLNDVNGNGFWTEGLRGDPKDGTITSMALGCPTVRGNQVSWRLESAWRDPAGHDLLTEIQAWRFQDRGHSYLLDLTWTLTACIDLRFGSHHYGGLTLCMPYSPDRGGYTMNSDGLVGLDAEQQRARWVAACMPIPGRGEWAGIAVMDHPANPVHPVPWRVDTQLRICPSRCIAGAWKLGRAASYTVRHRLFVFGGETVSSAIENVWKEFSDDPAESAPPSP